MNSVIKYFDQYHFSITNMTPPTVVDIEFQFKCVNSKKGELKTTTALNIFRLSFVKVKDTCMEHVFTTRCTVQCGWDGIDYRVLVSPRLQVCFEFRFNSRNAASETC